MAYYILKSYKLKASPQEIFNALRDEKNLFFLDSSLNSDRSLGRYSFLGFDPFYIVKAKDKEPFSQLRELLDKFKITLPQTSPPLLGGAVGYFSYDLGFLLEKKLKKRINDDLFLPDFYLGLYNSNIVIDHHKKLLYVFSIGFPEKSYSLSKTLCQKNFKKISLLLSRISSDKFSKQHRPQKQNPTAITSNFTKSGYIAAVNKAKDYIKKGDIYQVNLSQRFEAKTNNSAFGIYDKLKKASPSFFGGYFDCLDFQVLSSSPERFLNVTSGAVTTRPMKGTRSRSKNKARDIKLKKELLASAKDKAELVMIVDLMRNDLGRVCSYDSISADTLRELEKYSTVFQTTATVRGKLHQSKNNIDLLRAAFPGGSVTGCPKIRSMQIIEELETRRRSIYTGCLGYLSFSGNMDLNILIRTILKKGNRLYFSSGGGIVADSRPEEEYKETLVKAKGMMEALL